MIKDIADNFPYLIDTLGFVPNANRKYYLTRSQPPLLYLIVNILYQELGISAIKKYLPAPEKEYSFWMNSQSNINELNRYWDDSDTPRLKSYREDIEHAKNIKNKLGFYRNIRTYGLEHLLAKWFREISEQQKVSKYLELAEKRKQLIQDKFWKSEKEFFHDLNHNTTELTAITSLAGITPLLLQFLQIQHNNEILQMVGLRYTLRR